MVPDARAACPAAQCLGAGEIPVDEGLFVAFMVIFAVQTAYCIGVTVYVVRKRRGEQAQLTLASFHARQEHPIDRAAAADVLVSQSRHVFLRARTNANNYTPCCCFSVSAAV